MNDIVKNEVMEVSEAHQRVATANAQRAVTAVAEVKKNVDEELEYLKNLVENMYYKVTDLERKYHLLMSKNFNGGSTTE